MSVLACRASAATLAAAVFCFDIFTPVEGAVAVLYVVVVLIAARTARRGDIVLAGGACIALTLVAYLESHGLNHVGSPTLRALVSLAAIGITTVLAVQNQRATGTLASQARLLDLSHDMIFVRDTTGQITFWNRAAQDVYGWTAAEAIGQNADDLLRTRYHQPRQEIEATMVAAGRWEGTAEQRTRDGSVRAVESRWALQLDSLGRPAGVLETHTDVTDRKAAYDALVQSERRYRRMFDATRIGVVQQDWSALRAELLRLGVTNRAALDAHLAIAPGFLAEARRLIRIVDSNPAFQTIVGSPGPGDGPGDGDASLDTILDDGDRTFAGSMIDFIEGRAFHDGETELSRLDGSRVPVLFAITFPAAGDGDGNVLVFVVDITERRQSQDALLAAQSELAHAARVATLGELTASIAHEVNQPLMAVVTSGEAGLRWLRRPSPDLGEVEASIVRIVSEGRRASEIVARIRAFLKKAPSEKVALAVADLVADAGLLVERELALAQVELRVGMASALPDIRGDRIQLQQVLVNLLINAGQAMSTHAGLRILSLDAEHVAPGEVVITVADTGPGISPDDLARLFDPFFTTKQNGMGMGLAICRTTVEAHGGRLDVESTPGHGATFRVVLPVLQDEVTT